MIWYWESTVSLQSQSQVQSRSEGHHMTRLESHKLEESATVEPQSITSHKSTPDLKACDLIFHCIGPAVVFLNHKNLL